MSNRGHVRPFNQDIGFCGDIEITIQRENGAALENGTLCRRVDRHNDVSCFLWAPINGTPPTEN
jgi:hypothetical protein